VAKAVEMADEIVPKEPATIAVGTRRFELRALWRPTAWGGAAALALAAAVFASQTESGSQRLAAVATADSAVRPVATVKIPPRREQEWEIARLEAQLRTLTSDRDRLAERVAGLEHNIEDITGSIKRQSAQPITPAPPAAAAPVISSPATTEANRTEKSAPAAPPATAEAAAPPAAAPEQSAAPVHEAVPIAVPLPPVRVAALPAEAAASKPEFGVALATSSNLDVLRLQWGALKANYGPSLAGLRPIAAREQHGTATYYRLVLGPLPNAAAAAKLCARLTAARAVCHAGKFSGDPL
jgi:HAMP domain-containing protein